MLIGPYCSVSNVGRSSDYLTILDYNIRTRFSHPETRQLHLTMTSSGRDRTGVPLDFKPPFPLTIPSVNREHGMGVSQLFDRVSPSTFVGQLQHGVERRTHEKQPCLSQKSMWKP